MLRRLIVTLLLPLLLPPLFAFCLRYFRLRYATPLTPEERVLLTLFAMLMLLMPAMLSFAYVAIRCVDFLLIYAHAADDAVIRCRAMRHARQAAITPLHAMRMPYMMLDAFSLLPASATSRGFFIDAAAAAADFRHAAMLIFAASYATDAALLVILSPFTPCFDSVIRHA